MFTVIGLQAGAIDEGENPRLLSLKSLGKDKEARMADNETRLDKAEQEGKGYVLNASTPLLPCDAAILNALLTLGVTAQHTDSLEGLRTFSRAREAVGVFYDTFGDDLENFLTRPLADYGGKSVVNLVAEHGVRALEAIHLNVEYPVPA